MLSGNFLQLDPMAKQFLSKKAGARDSMSSRSLQELGSAKRELESLEEGLIAYDVGLII